MSCTEIAEITVKPGSKADFENAVQAAVPDAGHVTASNIYWSAVEGRFTLKLGGKPEGEKRCA